MAFATAVGVLAADPAPLVLGSVECLEAYCELQNGKDETVAALLRVNAKLSSGEVLRAKHAGDRLLFTGPLSLSDDGNVPVIEAAALCPATTDQVFAEVTVTGRASGSVREAEKSASTGVAESRKLRNEDGTFNEVTDWFTIRGYGWRRERILELPKGALVTVQGTFERRTSRDQTAYFEVKARQLRVHSRAKGTSTERIPAGVAGYSQADFAAEEPQMPSDWQ